MPFVIPLLVILAATLALVFIVARHLPDIAVINPESIPQEREGKIKNRILREKLIRNLRSGAQWGKVILLPVGEYLGNQYRQLVHTLRQLEHQTQRRAQPLQAIDAATKIKELLERGRQLQGQVAREAAEVAYIDVLALDATNLDAYEALTELYYEQRDYRKARETGKFLARLLQKSKEFDTHRLASNLACLGEIYQHEGKPEQALKNFQKAVALESSNPRLLDLLLKISIIMKRKDLAMQAFTDLRNADPKNQKLSEIEEEIKALPESDSDNEHLTINR